jgi:transposase-like protein
MEVSTMQKLPRQVYTSEFRRQAVEMVIRESLGIAEASRRLSLSPKTLTNRVRRAKGGGRPPEPTPRRAARSRTPRPRCHGGAGRTPNCGSSATS